MILLNLGCRMSGLPPIGYQYGDHKIRKNVYSQNRSSKNKTIKQSKQQNSHENFELNETGNNTSETELKQPIDKLSNFNPILEPEYNDEKRYKIFSKQREQLTRKYSSQKEIVPHSSNTNVHYNEEKNPDQTESIDLLSLVSFHSEYKQKIFGSEWQDKSERKKENRKSSLGSIGLNKPRRLEPIRGKSTSEKSVKRDFPRRFSISTGLHLSVNFASSVNDYTMDTFTKKGRRQNSLEEIKFQKSKEFEGGRPNSAPDNRNENVMQRESFLDDDVTPARANTPIDLSSSTHFYKPQPIGLSLATNSPEESINNSSRKGISYAQILSHNIDQSCSINSTGSGSFTSGRTTPLISIKKLMPLKYNESKLNNSTVLPTREQNSQPAKCIPSSSRRETPMPQQSRDKT